MASPARLLEQAQTAVLAAGDLAELDAVRVKYLGRKGLITAELKGLGKLPPEDRASAGREINRVKQAVVDRIASRRERLEAAKIEAELANRIDVTLPGRGQPMGGLHPVTRTLRRIVDIFAAAGFEVRSGPEVEDDYHNFTALNIPRITPRGRCTTPFTWIPATSCGPTPHPCRFARCVPRARRYESSLRGGSTGATTI